MHRNAPFWDKNSTNFLGRGHSPLPRPLPRWAGGHRSPNPTLSAPRPRPPVHQPWNRPWPLWCHLTNNIIFLCFPRCVSELLSHSPKIIEFYLSIQFYSNFTNKNVSWLHFSSTTSSTVCQLCFPDDQLLCNECQASRLSATVCQRRL